MKSLSVVATAFSMFIALSATQAVAQFRIPGIENTPLENTPFDPSTLNDLFRRPPPVGSSLGRNEPGGITIENSSVSMRLPTKMTTYHRDSNGRTYAYSMTAGGRSQLRVERPGKLLHVGQFIRTTTRKGEAYGRYRFTYTSDTAPSWAINATNRRTYEAWVPLDGEGVILYSANRGNTFVPESEVPPAGYARR